MQHPQFHDPQPVHEISAHSRAWLAGEISGLQCLAIEYRAEIAHHTAMLRGNCPPMAQAYHRRERARYYGKLRDLRKRSVH